MKSLLRLTSRLVPAATAFALCATALQSGTITTTFSFQKGDLRQDGSLYGAGASYAGVVDGHVTDSTATSALTTGVTATIGNQYRSTPAGNNGQQFVSLFSYDLSELKNFIDANTSATSTVAITSVSLKLVSTGGSASAGGNVFLYQTEPFTSGATWSTTNGSTAWSSPFQTGSTQYGYTGGGSPQTGNLGTAFPYVSTALVTAGASVSWTSSAAFLTSLNTALARTDKTLYLMAVRSNITGQDSRVAVNSSNPTTVDNRPELLVTLEVTTVAPLATWTGAGDTSWTVAGNWNPAAVPGAGAPVLFDGSSTSNLATVLNQDFDLLGITVTAPAGPVSIAGPNVLSISGSGIDLSGASQDLSISAPVSVGAAQTWTVATGRTLGISGAVSGASNLTIAGTGKVSCGATDILPSGAGKGNLVIDGTLDLNGNSQSMNGLSGSGVVDNTAPGSATLTVGNNSAGGTFSGILQNTGGSLALVKVGSVGLTLAGASTFSGGFTNNGSGFVYPQNNAAFGTGPVVMNGSTLYATAASYIFANSLTLNGTTLRVGGASSHTLTWNGPVTATGASGISADGSTGGITLGGTLDIAGATFTSYANGTTNSFNGSVSGAGGVLNVTGGTLQVASACTYTGTTTISGAGVLRLQPGGTLSSSSNLVINGASSNFNVRNTVNWVYGGTVSGDGAGQINLNSGTNATLTGSISGVAAVNANSSGTHTAISGDISGGTSVNVQSSGVVFTLSGNNSYSGTTNVTGGTLVIASSGALPGATNVTLNNGTLSLAASTTCAAGTLDAAGAATIDLGAGATLAFTDSSAVDWTGGTLHLTGNFVPGASLRFGTSGGGLGVGQLASIAATGWTSFALDDNGYLTASAVGSYDIWAAQITNGLDARDEDADGDGFTNLEEFLFGTSPIAGNASLVTTTRSGGNLTLRWLQRESGATYTLQQNSTLAPGSWTPVAPPAPAPDTEQTGAPADYDYYSITLTIGGGTIFYRIEGVEN